MILLRGLHRQSMKFDPSICSKRRWHSMVNFLPLLNVFHVRLMGHLSIVLLIRHHFDAGLLDRRVKAPGFLRRYLLLYVQHLDVIQLLRTFGSCRWSLIGARVHYTLVGGNLLTEHDFTGPICSRF